jgi:hypothetical protein
MDVDGDGWIDFITAGWEGTAIYWRRNPGNNNKWQNIIIGKQARGNYWSMEFNGNGRRSYLTTLVRDRYIFSGYGSAEWWKKRYRSCRQRRFMHFL